MAPCWIIRTFLRLKPRSEQVRVSLDGQPAHHQPPTRSSLASLLNGRARFRWKGLVLLEDCCQTTTTEVAINGSLLPSTQVRHCSSHIISMWRRELLNLT